MGDAGFISSTILLERCSSIGDLVDELLALLLDKSGLADEPRLRTDPRCP